MKIGASTLCGFKDSIESNLDYFEELGIRYAEILHQFPNEQLNTDSLNSYNLKYSIHSPILNINIGSLNKAIRKASIAEIKKSIDLANKIDCDIVVVHPGMIPFLGKDYEDFIYGLTNSAIKELGEYGNDLGVLTTIENMPAFEGMMYQNIESLTNTLEEYNMFMTLDVGHANHTNHRPNEMYSNRVKHIHIHDNTSLDDEHLALGEGYIDLKTIIGIYEENKFDGVYTIEVNTPEAVKKSLSYLNSL